MSSEADAWSPAQLAEISPVANEFGLVLESDLIHEAEEVLHMRAIVFDSYGEPNVMSLREAPAPEPQDGEVLIRVGYAGVSPSDSKARSGQAARAGYRVRRFDFPILKWWRAQ
jgi:hypothetical protein